MLSCKIKKGMKIAHVEAGNVVPPIVAPQPDENVPWKAAVNALKRDLLGNPPKENRDRLQKLFKGLDLKCIESWTEKQQQSVRDLLMEYQHLFAMNLNELGKMSMVQHDIT